MVFYAVLTWQQPQRAVMLSIGLAALLLVPPLLLLLPAGSATLVRWRATLYYSLEIVGIGVVTTLVWLDGGLGSPLTLLYLVVLVHGMAVYPTSVAMGMTALVLGAYLLLALAAGVDVARATTAAGAILLTAAVAAIGARSHISLQQHQLRIQALLHRQARTDGLTGARNRQGIEEAIDAQLARTASDSPTAVLALDLDGFKVLNDTEGHPVGDRILQQVVAILEHASRADDVIGRQGGDEFLVLLPDADGEAAGRVAARIHERLATESVPVTVSIGIATTTRREDARALLARADEALYSAKRDGRGRTCRALVSH